MSDRKDKRTESKIGYMDSKVAISHKHVGESPNTGIVKDCDSGDTVVIAGKPTFVIHPMTKKRVNIKDIFKHPKETKCPKCGEMNEPGVIFRVLENGQFIYECPKCKNYTFCQLKG